MVGVTVLTIPAKEGQALSPLFSQIGFVYLVQGSSICCYVLGVEVGCRVVVLWWGLQQCHSGGDIVEGDGDCHFC